MSEVAAELEFESKTLYLIDFKIVTYIYFIFFENKTHFFSALRNILGRVQDAAAHSGEKNLFPVLISVSLLVIS